jgi:hypothetical protein
MGAEEFSVSRFPFRCNELISNSGIHKANCCGRNPETTMRPEMKSALHLTEVESPLLKEE